MNGGKGLYTYYGKGLYTYYVLLRRSLGEEGMQLVQPSKFFSVTIFRTRFYRQYWHARVRTVAMLLFLVTLKNFDVCTVTHYGSCMPSSPKEYIQPLMVVCAGSLTIDVGSKVIFELKKFS